MRDKNSIKKSGTIKLAGICGILAPFILFTSILFAVSCSPWFKWTNNALSDLGVEGVSASVFNNGLIFGGILAFIFTVGLAKILSNKTGAYLLAIGALSLVGVGLVPITMYVLHYIVSAAFFVLLTIGLLIIGITLKRNKFDQSMGDIAIVFALLASISPLTLSFSNGIAVPETIICFLAFLWCMSYGVKMTMRVA